MRVKRIVSAVLASAVLFSTAVFAKQADYKLQLYFQPSVMNDITGEVVTSVNLKNVNLLLPEVKDGICSIEFDYKYDNTVFDVLKDDKGNIVIDTDNNTLIKNKTKLSAVENNGKIHISYNDNENLINFDGTICKFTLIAKNVNKLWNSFDKYPIRFEENSVFVNTLTEGQYYNFECIDGKVGAYNKAVTFEQPSVNKNIVFFNGKSDMLVNGKVVQTDAVPFVSGEMWMIPMRYFAENTDMEVEWDDEKSTACAYGENKTVKVSLKDNNVYINSALYSREMNPVEINGRTYIPLSLVKELYSNVSVNSENNKLTIYIP